MITLYKFTFFNENNIEIDQCIRTSSKECMDYYNKHMNPELVSFKIETAEVKLDDLYWIKH